MAASDPHEKPPDSPPKKETPPEAMPLDDEEDKDPFNPDDMTLEEFLENVYYNPFGPPPGAE